MRYFKIYSIPGLQNFVNRIKKGIKPGHSQPFLPQNLNNEEKTCDPIIKSITLFQHPASSIQHPASSIQHPASNIPLLFQLTHSFEF